MHGPKRLPSFLWILSIRSRLFRFTTRGKARHCRFITLGDGTEAIALKVAIRGIPGQVKAEEVEEVWQWGTARLK